MNKKIMLVMSVFSCVSLHAFTFWNNTSRKIKLMNIEYHALYPRLTYLQMTQEKFISQQPYCRDQNKANDVYVDSGKFASHKQAKSFRLTIQSTNSGMYVLDKIVDGLDDHIGIALNKSKDGTIYTTKFIHEALTIFNNTERDIRIRYVNALSTQAEELTIKNGKSVPNFQLSWSSDNDDKFETVLEAWHEDMPSKIYRGRYHGTEANKSQGLIIFQEDEYGAITSHAI